VTHRRNELAADSKTFKDHAAVTGTRAAVGQDDVAMLFGFRILRR